MDIYKITQSNLTPTETSFSIIKFDPIIGKDLSTTEYFEYIVPEYNRSGFLLTPGELGCSLSHIAIYNRIVESETPAIVLEDDIYPTENQLEQALDIIRHSNAEFIHLGWHPDSFYGTYFYGKKTNHIGLFEVFPFLNFHGTYAYFLTPRAAKKLIEFHEESIKLADSWALFFYRSGIKPYFYGAFVHPQIRSELAINRSIVNRTPYRFRFNYLAEKVKILIRQKLLPLNFGFKPIRVPEELRGSVLD